MSQVYVLQLVVMVFKHLMKHVMMETRLLKSVFMIRRHVKYVPLIVHYKLVPPNIVVIKLFKVMKSAMMVLIPSLVIAIVPMLFVVMELLMTLQAKHVMMET